MMASNLLSRFLPSNPVSPSLYEELRTRTFGQDAEERAGMSVDEENLNTGFHDYDLENADAFGGTESRITTDDATFTTKEEQARPRSHSRGHRKNKVDKGKARWLPRSPMMLYDDGDDDVPASLLIEGESGAGPNKSLPPRPSQTDDPPSMAGPSAHDAQTRWTAAQAQQRLHRDDNAKRPGAPVPRANIIIGDPKEKALWTWINVVNLDHFMTEVYEYYVGAGIWCICLEQLVNLLTILFVATFTTFLTQCIDYKSFRHKNSLSEVLVENCTNHMSLSANLSIWLLALGLLYWFVPKIFQIRRLKTMHDFYLHLLNIPDSDMQTISWQEVVARLMALRDVHPLTAERTSPQLLHYMDIRSQSKQRMDAHDIANRVMRKDNYMIALVNKDILNLKLPIPFLRNRELFTKATEMSIYSCILDQVFTPSGQIKEDVLKETKRKELSNLLRRRFMRAGIVNAIAAPAIVMYLLITWFLKNFNEYRSNPSSLGFRQYTPLAEWKFREFNELEHLFDKRINMSYPFASRYLDQFPKRKMVLTARFVAFVAGAVVSVLALASVIDPELFLGFEITKDKTVLFYLGVMGTVWAIANGAIPPENLVFDPEYSLRDVIEYTHYMPNHWKDRLHSDEVKREFSELYQMKVVIFLEQVLSVIFTPFVLWFSLPQSSDRIIDFFREFTIHVDGLGYVCSFAVFDFNKGVMNNSTQGGAKAAQGLRDEYYSTKHGKMAASYYGFMDNYATNPKTGIPGHVPHSMRFPYHPPPSFPGLMSPTLGADLHGSRIGRSERRSSRAPPGIAPGRTPRFGPSAAHASPMPSMLLDPHHQPSTSGFGGGRSMHAPSGRSRYKTNIVEYPVEAEEEEEGVQDQGKESGPEEDFLGMDESKWETSPTRTPFKTLEEEDEAAAGNGGGVLGLLYQFQKAQSGGRRPGLKI